MNAKLQLLAQAKSPTEEVRKKLKESQVCSTENVGELKLRFKKMGKGLSNIPIVGEGGKPKLRRNFIEYVTTAHRIIQFVTESLSMDNINEEQKKSVEKIFKE